MKKIMRQTIYVCGNVILEQDNMPFKILPELRENLPELDFIEFDPSENFPPDDPLLILDTVLGANEVTVIKDVEKLADSPRISVHDSDLGFHLKWLKKMGNPQKVIIFGVPAAGDKEKLAGQLAAAIRKFTAT
jgi:hypothetical protein